MTSLYFNGLTKTVAYHNGAPGVSRAIGLIVKPAVIAAGFLNGKVPAFTDSGKVWDHITVHRVVKIGFR